jgi:ubiquitin-activating enzyme E1 C
VGRPKAEVAAEFVQKRVKGVSITPYCGKIQDKDEDYYMQFSMVVCGLDSIEARRWINATLVGMVDMENPESMKPLIDGGTEGTLCIHLYFSGLMLTLQQASKANHAL